MSRGADPRAAERRRGGIRRAGPEEELREEPREELRRDVLAGLAAERKDLPPKYFYDARGSRLFERITELPEYYLTRAEREILERVAPELVAELRPRALVEFGSGSSAKTRILLDAMRATGPLEGYAPIDASASALEEATARLALEYPGLRVEGVVGDFRRFLALPFRATPRLIAFLGSTIGNLEPPAALGFLERVAAEMRPPDGFLVGFDLVKARGRLEAAYNDAAGVTAEFNRNVLRVLNRELGADFDPEAFRHLAFYDEEKARIEMYLVSEVRQTVRIADLGLEVELEAGETIRTELSHKYTRSTAAGLLERAGLRVARWETDAGDRFAVALARPEA